MGDAMKAAGLGPQVKHGGEVYQFAVLDHGDYARMEAWLERQAVEAVRRQKAYLPPAEYAEKVQNTDRDIASQVYTAGGERFNFAFTRSHPGLKEAARLALQKHHPGADEELVDDLFRDHMPDMIRAAFTVQGYEFQGDAPDGTDNAPGA